MKTSDILIVGGVGIAALYFANKIFGGNVAGNVAKEAGATAGGALANVIIGGTTGIVGGFSQPFQVIGANLAQPVNIATYNYGTANVVRYDWNWWMPWKPVSVTFVNPQTHKITTW
jgi:hypothetical protein